MASILVSPSRGGGGLYAVSLGGGVASILVGLSQELWHLRYVSYSESGGVASVSVSLNDV